MLHVLTGQPVVVAVEIPLEWFVYVLESPHQALADPAFPPASGSFFAIGILGAG
jgi:hypothetical protein